MSQSKLSVAMIARNEEAVVERALKTVVWADEIVVVDTGSTDKTEEIASKYGRLYHFEWIDDFAAARNFAIEQCTNDWILTLDADDQLEPDGIQKIKEAIENKVTDHDSISMGVYWQGFKKKSHQQVRVYKKNIRYMYTIHEYPAVQKTLETDIKINHTSSPSHNLDKDRNIRMLQKAEQSPRNKYYLACEYYWKGEYDKAIELFEEYVRVSTFIAERADAYLMMARCLWASSRGDEARENCMRAIINNPNFKAAHDLMAEMSWPKQAVVWRKFAKIANNEDVLFER